MISIISAEEKKRELKSATVEVQQCIADAAKEATTVPFNIKPYPIGHVLFGGEVDYPALSAWLKNAGWALLIQYTDTGNNDIINRLTVKYYTKRGYLEEKAIVQVCDNTLIAGVPFYM